MTQTLIPRPSAALPTQPRLSDASAATAQPAIAYLMSLRSDVGRASMTSELRKVARLMGVPNNDWRAVNWATLNAANVSAVMAQVQGAPASRNKTLAALGGTSIRW